MSRKFIIKKHSMKISETSIALLNNVNRVLQGVKRGKKTIIN